MFGPNNTCILLWIIISLIGQEAAAQVFYDDGRQISGSDSIANGNPNALFINPAFLGKVDDKHFTGQFLQVGFNGYSDFLNRNDLSTFTLSDDSIPLPEKMDWLDIAAHRPLDYQVDVAVSWVSGSYASPKFGGLAISLTDKVDGQFALGQEMIDLLLNGNKANWIQGADTNTRVILPENIEVDHLHYRHIREFTVGYGRRLLHSESFSLHAGANYSYLWGIGLMRLEAANGGISGASAFSQLYDISYGALSSNFNDLSQQLLDHSGRGYSLGLGISLDIQEQWTLAASLQDLGRLVWTEQLVRTQTDSLFVHPSLVDGIGTFNWSQETDLVYDAFQFQPEATFEETLAPTLRCNAIWRATRTLSLNGDFVYRSTGTFQPREMVNIMLAASHQPLRGMINVNVALLHNSAFGFRIPIGIAGNFGHNNTLISISTNDVITLLQNRQQPLNSLSIATLSQRF